MRVSGHKIQFIKCRRCGRRGHSLSECVDYCLRIETASLLHQISPALMKLLKDNTKATEVITGHNSRGPCKHWGYVRFSSFEDREEAASCIYSLIHAGILHRRVLKADRGPFPARR